MMRAYRYDSQKIATGETVETTETAGLPIGWTRTPPPEVPDGKFAQFVGRSGWVLVDERPPAPEVPPEVPQPGRLTVSAWSLLADGADSVVVRFPASGAVHFVVEGVPHTVAPVEGVAAITVRADAPGPIHVQVQDQQVVLLAQEVEE